MASSNYKKEESLKSFNYKTNPRKSGSFGHSSSLSAQGLKFHPFQLTSCHFDSQEFFGGGELKLKQKILQKFS